jgi:hypothetical protein
MNLVRLFPQNSPIQYEETCCWPYSCPHCEHSPSNPISSAPPRHFRSIFNPHTIALDLQMSHSLFPSTNPSLPAPYISPSHSQLFFPAQPPNLTTNNAQRLPQLYSHKAWVRKHLPSYWSAWFGKAKKKDKSKSENRDGNAEHDDRSMRSNQSPHREGRGDVDDHDGTYTFVRLTQLDWYVD